MKILEEQIMDTQTIRQYSAILNQQTNNRDKLEVSAEYFASMGDLRTVYLINSLLEGEKKNEDNRVA